MQEQRNTIDPYYKKGNVFERDQAYYSQMLGSRRTNLRNSSRGNSQQRATLEDRSAHVNPVNQKIIQSKTYAINSRQEGVSNQDYSIRVSTANKPSQQYNEAVSTNNQLKAQLEQLISGNSDFGLSENVVKLSHYTGSQGDQGKLKQNEAQIRRLEELIQANNDRIQSHKKAGEELTLRMNNIQSIDKQIYKTLKGSVNRDKELLDRASSALARGEKREEIAKILQMIIG